MQQLRLQLALDGEAGQMAARFMNANLTTFKCCTSLRRTAKQGTPMSRKLKGAEMVAVKSKDALSLACRPSASAASAKSRSLRASAAADAVTSCHSHATCSEAHLWA